MERLRTGDEVIVVSGAHKGSKGRVKKLVRATGRVVVEGVNIIKRHTKSTPQNAGGIVQREAPIDASNVMPVDPETGKPTRVRIETREGKKVRLAKSGAVITASVAAAIEG